MLTAVGVAVYLHRLPPLTRLRQQLENRWNTTYRTFVASTRFRGPTRRADTVLNSWASTTMIGSRRDRTSRSRFLSPRWYWPSPARAVPIFLISHYVVLNWSALLLGHAHSLDARSLLSAGAPVLALGYMFEKDRALREGEWVRDFVLLPEAGHILHPAHRFGD
jgi:hypothetical protein